MPRMIAVEGPDGAGKSTLLDRLAKSLNRYIVHSGGPPSNHKEWIDKMMLVAAYRDRAVLFDRLPHISERVYGPIGGREAFDNPDFLDRELFSLLKPVIIYCRLPSVQIMQDAISFEMKAHKPIEHIQQVVENYPRVVEAYDRLISRLEEKGVTILRYAWTEDSYPQLVQKIGELECVA